MWRYFLGQLTGLYFGVWAFALAARFPGDDKYWGWALGVIGAILFFLHALAFTQTKDE